MLRNFSFVINNRLAGLAEPGAHGSLRADLQELAEQGITALVSLTEDDLERRAVREKGFDYLHLPVADFMAPSLQQIRKFVDFARRHLNAKEKGAVAVHCRMGYGRTGTLLACYLVSTGVPAEEAIRTVRRLRPGSIETKDQERAVSAYQAYLQEMGEFRRVRRGTIRGADKKRTSASRKANAAHDKAGKVDSIRGTRENDTAKKQTSAGGKKPRRTIRRSSTKRRRRQDPDMFGDLT